MPIINCNQFQRIWNGGFAPLRRSFCTITLVDGIEITIGGHDRSSIYRPSSLSIKEDLNSRGTANFILEDPTNTLSIKAGESVVIRKNTLTPSNTERLIFAGTVDIVEDRWPSMDITSPYHQIKIKCVDNNALADRFLVARRYDSGSLPGEIVEDLRSNYLEQEGVTIGNIEDGSYTLGQVDFNYQTVTECIDDLSELVGGFIWYIDHDRKLYFQDRDTTSAGFGYSNSSLPLRSLTRKKSREGYRNRQYLRAGRDIQVTANSEEFAGDGERTSFTVGLPIGEEPTITLNGSAQTVGINGVNEGKNWYWQKGSNTVEQDSSGDELESSDLLKITYKGLLSIIVQADDDTQVAERAALEGGSGIYERIEDDERIEDADFSLSRANGILERFGAINEIVTIKTDNGALRAGEVQSIELDREGLSGEYLIQSLSARDRGDGEFVYSYKCVDGAQVGGWVDFFRKLSRAGRTFEIRDNEIFIILREKDVNLRYSDSATGSTTSGLDSFTDDPYSVFLISAGTPATIANPTGSYIGSQWTSADGTRRAAGGKIGTIRNG